MGEGTVGRVLGGIIFEKKFQTDSTLLNVINAYLGWCTSVLFSLNEMQ